MKLPGSLIAGAVIGLVVGAAMTGYFLSSGGGAGDAAGQGAGPGGRGGPGRGGYVPAVSMAVAETAAIGKTIDVIGEARALKSVTITSEVTGIVDKVNLAPGKRVKEGDVLLRLDDRQQQIALTRAKAQYPIAKENAERYRNLAADQAGSELEAEQAFNNFKAVEADLRAAEYAVEQRAIKAPFDGVVGLTTIEAGDYLRAGDVITSLDDTSSIVVEFAVPQETASDVEVGQAVTARLASGVGGAYDGAVTAIDSRVDPASRTLRIEATFPNKDGRLLPGAVFAVSTTSEGAPAVAVPGLAIQWDRAGAYVWKRDADGAAKRASVSILQRTDEIVLVEGDIVAGDQIVSEGADRVRAGLPLPSAAPRSSDVSAGGGVVSAGGMAND